MTQTSPETLVGIGCEPEQELPAEVLAFSIRAKSDDVGILKLHQAHLWSAQDEIARREQRTPFSLQRFLLSEEVIRRGAGMGIYMDSDMLVLRPLSELREAFEASGADIATVETRPEWRRKRQSSVMVFNQAGAERLWHSYLAYGRGKISYDQLLYLETVGPIGDLPYSWNCLEYLDDTTGLIHYTDMDRQPWLKAGNPNAGVWYAFLWRFAQTAQGRALLDEAVTRLDVRPGLKAIADHGPSQSSEATRVAIEDLRFIPPHRFARIKSRRLRRVFGPLLRGVMSLQFAAANGQLNIR